MTPKKKASGRTRSERLKERLFPDVPCFNTKGGGFAPLPMVLRAMLWHFKPTTWMVLTAIYMRASKEGICWFEIRELGFDMDFKSAGKLRLHLRSLEDDYFIVRREEGGREYFAARDPRTAIKLLVEEGRIPQFRLDAINEVLENVKHEPIENATDSSDKGA